MANNPIIYNGALSGATGGIHERWITLTQSIDYVEVRNAIIEFAEAVDAAIATDPTTSLADGNLIQSITQGVLAQRYINPGTDFTALAQAVAALYSVLRVSQEPAFITTDDVISTADLTDMGVPANSTLTTVLEIAVNVATEDAPGYVSRHVYVNAASARLGTQYMDVECEAATVWTTEADIPPGNWFRIVEIAGGGGGSSGMQGHTSASHGGAGGGGGAYRLIIASRAELISWLPITIAAGLGGTGGIAVPVTVGTVATVQGVNGGSATFGPWSVFGGGAGNASGQSALCGGGGGGGQNSAGIGGLVSVAFNPGGHPLGGTNTSTNPTTAQALGIASHFGGGSGGGSSGTIAAPGANSIYGGGGGGGPAATATSVGNGFGGSSIYGGAGGGAGGFNNNGGTPNAGSAGGSTAGGTLAGGAAGAGANPVASPGSPGQDSPNAFTCAGSGGGGGGSAGDSGGGFPTTGGAGGEGGFPGGGGGGGGTCTADAGQFTNAGNGGNGGDAAIVIEAMR